ncbi:MAG: flagellar hook-associated protein 3 [Betaproteobacteria bacterium HGW-Betaproteobacteria-21]|nr:MAG: flagellar hook-associated protein 3 [Betaproteobacteria bacterium HGW-Betaproteobacteria-21]
MRISTSMIFDKGAASIQQQSASLMHLGQQVASGKRILTPADDPVGAARVLDLTQAKGINAQYATNQGYANDQLKLVESKLGGVSEILQYARERAVQAGSGTLNAEDRRYIAADMRSQFDALMALANTRDANNEYMFGGYRSQAQPFTGNLAGVSYEGDQGVRTLQVSSSRFMPVSFAGSEVFEGGVVSKDEVGVFNSAGATDKLSASFSPPQLDSANSGKRYEISYDSSLPGYSVVEFRPGNPDPILVARDPDTTNANGDLELNFNGLTVTVNDTSSGGEKYEVIVPSANVFDNFALFIDGLERPGAGGVSANIEFALQSFDAGLESVLKVRAQVGSQMVEVEQLQNIGSDLNIQYATTLSSLQDLDYAEALTDLTMRQTLLQAAQQSFMRVSGLSLFNYLQ